RAIELAGDLLWRKAALPRHARTALDEQSREVLARAGTDQPELRVGHALGDDRPRLDQQVESLVELERADEERHGALRQRRGRGQERIEVHERGKGRG